MALYLAIEHKASSMTSPKLTLQDLSHDILVEILNVTDDATLMACESVSLVLPDIVLHRQVFFFRCQDASIMPFSLFLNLHTALL
jgi:hypothetical protein